MLGYCTCDASATTKTVNMKHFIIFIFYFVCFEFCVDTDVWLFQVD